MGDSTAHRARKRFGQHFLTDTNIIDKLIRCINPVHDERFVEIGPGLGALTCPMLQHVDQLDVIELDRDVIPKLVRNCGDAEGLRVHESDILKFDMSSLVTDDRLRVIGNLPYNISTAVLFHLLDHRELIIDMHFMLQKEVVDRIAARAGSKDYGRLSVMLQTWFDADSLFDVAPGCFSPPPKVQSAIVRLVPMTRYSERVLDANNYADLVRQAFSQRRKTLRNTLRQTCEPRHFEAAGVDPGARAETLRIDDFLDLHAAIERAPPFIQQQD